MLYETSAPLLIGTTLLRVIRSVLPVATLWISKLIVDAVVQWILHRRGVPRDLWKLVALDLALGIASDTLSRGNGLLDSLLGERFANKTSIRLMLHASELDLGSFEDPVFYDKLERARRLSTTRLTFFTALLNLFQDALTLMLLSGGLVAFSPWLIPLLIPLLILAITPVFWGKRISFAWPTHFSIGAHRSVGSSIISAISELARRAPRR